MNKFSTSTDLSRLLQDFFIKRLIQQRHASHQTVTGYRDTFRLLLRFAEHGLGKKITELCLGDLDAPLVLSFLDYLETERGNCIRSRNARLAAIRSFLHYAALQEPAALPEIRRVLAIPMKRFERPVVGFLTREEMEAIISAPNKSTWSGRRDRALLCILYNTGARVSEIIAVKRSDMENDLCSAVHLHGKGRKERVVPLWSRTSRLLREWLPQIGSSPQQALFPNRYGHPLTRSGVEKRLQVAVKKAWEACPSIKNKKVSPHIIRHTTAMHLLQAGVDLTVIALWLGHESIETTHQYLQANLEMKERALAKVAEPNVSSGRFKPGKDVLSFLNSL